MRTTQIVLLVTLLAACGGSPAAEAPTAAPAPAAATSAPTAAPTAAPKPTNTPAPTSTPEPTATPTVIPSPTPLPQPVTFEGSGKKVTDKFSPPGSVNRITLTHTGKRNFIVTAYDAEGKSALLVNTIGGYQGQRLLFGSDAVYLEIDADGPWTAIIESLVRNDTPIESLEGKGDTVTDAFLPSKTGPIPYAIAHDGSRNFIVELYCAGGQDLVMNEIGATNSEAVVRMEEGPCLWEIQADGSWSIKPK